jgi:hypothetical protein
MDLMLWTMYLNRVKAVNFMIYMLPQFFLKKQNLGDTEKEKPLHNEISKQTAKAQTGTERRTSHPH